MGAQRGTGNGRAIHFRVRRRVKGVVSPPKAFAVAAVAVAGLFSGWMVCADVDVAPRGDWRAVSEGLYRSGQKGVLGADRRALIHFHSLDGRSGRLTIRAAARRPGAPVTVVGSTAGPSRTAVLDTSFTSLEWPVAPGSRQLDLRLEASGLFRVSSIVLHRHADWTMAVACALPGAVGLFVLMTALRRGPLWAAVAWAVLSTLGTAALWMALIDPSSALRAEGPTRDGLRAAALVILWATALASADRRAAATAAVVGTLLTIHLPDLGFGFHQDDYVMARDWKVGELLRALVGPFDPTGTLASYYRPMVTLTWAIEHRLWGAHTAFYHLTNLALHGSATFMLLALLRRLGLAGSSVLLATLVWTAHPVAASTVAWVSARGDSLMAVFYLGALVVFCAPTFSARRRLLVGALSGAALCSKEMAVSLPLVALLLDRLLLTREDRARRRPDLWIVTVVTTGYIALWVTRFAERLVAPCVGVSGRAWDGQSMGDGLRRIAGLYATVFAPLPYETWWAMSPADWPVAWLWAGIGIPLALFWAARRDRRGQRMTWAGLFWAAVTVVPLLALTGPLDFYRVGYLSAVSVAFAVGAVVSRCRMPWVGVAAAVLAAPLAVLSIGASRAWAQDGFQVRGPVRWRLAESDWNARLTPEMADLFRQTVAHQCHAIAWVYPDRPCP